VRIDYRWGAGDADRFRRYAAELVALAPDVILATMHGHGAKPMPVARDRVEKCIGKKRASLGQAGLAERIE
jgi:hypothetical protein